MNVDVIHRFADTQSPFSEYAVVKGVRLHEGGWR
jgi:hypothetical protein